MFAAHFERENRDRLVLAHGDMLGDVERKARLAHARAARHDNELRGLKAGQLLVHERKARAHAHEAVLGLCGLADALVPFEKRHPEVRQAAVGVVLGDLIDLVRRRVQNVRGRGV